LHTAGTPKEVKPVVKKKRLDYKQSIQKSLQVAVVFKDDPTRKMTENERSHIWRVASADIQLIDMTLHNSQAPRPQFYRSGLVFRITCTDQASLTWLWEAENMIEAIEGHTYHVVSRSIATLSNGVKVWIPGEKSELRLAKQNQGLATSGWKLIHRQEKDKGQLLVLGVSDESLKKLRSTGGRVHLELSQVTFELPSQWQMDALQ